MKVKNCKIIESIPTSPEKQLEKLRKRLEQNHPKLAEFCMHLEIKHNYNYKPTELQIIRYDGQIIEKISTNALTEADMEEWLRQVDLSFEFMKQFNVSPDTERISIIRDFQCQFYNLFHG